MSPNHNSLIATFVKFSNNFFLSKLRLQKWSLTQCSLKKYLTSEDPTLRNMKISKRDININTGCITTETRAAVTEKNPQNRRYDHPNFAPFESMLKAHNNTILLVLQIKKSCCGDKENALDFYKAQVMECDESALTTYDKIVESRLNRHDRYTRLESAEGRSSSVSDISKMIREALGLHSSDDLVCSTAFVEFKSLTAKQSGK